MSQIRAEFVADPGGPSYPNSANSYKQTFQFPLDSYSFRAQVNLNRPGSWSIEVPADSDIALSVASGIAMNASYVLKYTFRAWLNQRVFISGPLTGWERSESSDTDLPTMRLYGVDNNIIAQDTIVYPDPASPASSQKRSFWYTNTAVGVGGPGNMIALVSANCGVGALGYRRIGANPSQAPLVLSSTPSNTESVNLKFAWCTLEEALDQLAGGAWRYQFRDVANGAFDFNVTPRVDRTSEVTFSVNRGSLASGNVAFSWPTKTRAIVLGEGEGTAKKVVEATFNPLPYETFGRRIERVVDGRGGKTTSELTSLGKADLLDGYQSEWSIQAETTADNLTTSTGGALRIGLEWNIGDLVNVNFSGGFSGINVTSSIDGAVLEFGPEGARLGLIFGNQAITSPWASLANFANTTNKRIQATGAAAGSTSINRDAEAMRLMGA